MGLGPRLLREVLCTVLRRMPDDDNWSPYPNIWGECHDLIEKAPWYRVYDFVEELYQEIDSDEEWAERINEYFVEAGVGWRFVDGKLESRGAEGFETAVDAARDALGSAGLRTAQKEIHEALRDLSQRPEPDLTGAVTHAMGALECTSREVTGDTKQTFGEIIKRHPELFPEPLATALEKIWGICITKSAACSRREYAIQGGSRVGRRCCCFRLGLSGIARWRGLKSVNRGCISGRTT